MDDKEYCKLVFVDIEKYEMIYDSKDTEISDLRSHLSSLCYKSAAVVRGQ